MKKSISISSRKAKGRKLQQYVANKIGKLLGLPVGKDLDIESRQMSQSGVDIILRGEALRDFPFSVECKSQETWSVPAWIEQAEKNTKQNTHWLLFMKRKREKPVIVMDAETFFEIYRF